MTSGRRTVRDSVDSFVEDRKPSDQDTWAAAIVIEGLGSARLTDLSVSQCGDFFRVAAAGLGDRRSIGLAQLRKLRQFLVAALNNEMRVGTLNRNVADLAPLPSIESGEIERRALARYELRRLLDAAVGSRLVIIDLCARSGLRPAEARGLLWDDLDLDRRTLTVTGQLDRQNRRTAPKTRKAARTIQLDDATVTRLKLWSERQVELKIGARSAWQETGIVASTNQGTPIDRHSLARSLRLLCRRASIDPAVTPYELRHTAISMQADAGRSSWELADWAGTSEAMINRVYRHRLQRVSAILRVDEPYEPDGVQNGSKMAALGAFETATRLPQAPNPATFLPGGVRAPGGLPRLQTATGRVGACRDPLGTKAQALASARCCSSLAEDVVSGWVSRACCGRSQAGPVGGSLNPRLLRAESARYRRNWHSCAVLNDG